MAVPNIFANATASIPLSQLDANFATTITLGNTAIQLGNTVTTLNNMTLANVTISSGTSNLSSTAITNGTSNVTIASSGGAVSMASNGAVAVTVDTSQNVGIGSTTPSAFGGFKTLAIGGDSGSSTSGVLQFINNGTEGLRIVEGSSTVEIIENKNIPMLFGTNATERMRITSTGELLVNTTTNSGSPGKITVLTASGDSSRGVAIGISTSSYRNIYMFSDTVLYFSNGSNQASLSEAGAWTNASDARLKKNIVDIKYGLADVLKAQPRSYQMNSVGGDFVGFIAQELKEVIPEVVSGNPEVQLGVDYGSLVAVAFKAIQELKAINDTQAETINALTARMVAFEAK
jgi:hypothetical protein